MQHAGTLRKRSRRPIIKVNGLGANLYNEESDYFNIDSSVGPSQNVPRRYPSSSSGILYKNSDRITRKPMYHDYGDENNVDIEAGRDTECNADGNHVSSSSQKKNHDRPYLLSSAVFNRLRIIIFLGMLCLNAPWVWNRKTQRIDRWNSFMVKIWKLYWCFASIQSFGMMVYHMYCLHGIYSRNLESYRGIFAYSLIVYWYVSHLAYKVCIYIYEDQMRKYINLLQDFNQEYVGKYLVYADEDMDFSSAKLIVKFSMPAAISQIANSLFFFLAMPYQPFYLTSMINPRPWYALIPGALQDLTVIGQTIVTYITISWIKVAHASSIEFWLREMHKGSESVYTTDALRTYQVTIPTYRSLQLLCSDFNACMAPLCIPCWKVSMGSGFVACGYLCVRSMNQVFIQEFPGILVYPFGTINCSTMGFGCLTMAAEMYDIANSFIYSWASTKHKNFRRVLLSCPTLKMKVGRFYFYTAATTVRFFQVMTGYIIDSLLTFP